MVMKDTDICLDRSLEKMGTWIVCKVMKIWSSDDHDLVASVFTLSDILWKICWTSKILFSDCKDIRGDQICMCSDLFDSPILTMSSYLLVHWVYLYSTQLVDYCSNTKSLFPQLDIYYTKFVKVAHWKCCQVFMFVHCEIGMERSLAFAYTEVRLILSILNLKVFKMVFMLPGNEITINRGFFFF